MITEDKMQSEGCAYIRKKEIVQGVSVFHKCIAFTLLLSISLSFSILSLIYDQNEIIHLKCLLECLVHGKYSIYFRLLLLT